MSYLPYLLEALPSVRQPGKIVGPFADLMGKVYNLLFELLHSNTSAGSLGLAIIIFTLIGHSSHQPCSAAKDRIIYRIFL